MVNIYGVLDFVLDPLPPVRERKARNFPPAALRRVGVREILDVRLAQGPVGYLPSVNTTSFSGNSVTGYQSSELASTPCGVGRCAQVRLMGQAPEGHTGAKRELAHRAEVGRCPRCAALTHVAAPPSFALGALDALKAQWAQFRVEFGPRRGCNLAACHYNVARRYLPGTWDSAASPVGIGAPDPLLTPPPQSPKHFKGKPTVGCRPLHPFLISPFVLFHFAAPLRPPIRGKIRTDRCCPPGARSPSPATDRGAAPLNSTNGGVCTPTHKGESHSLLSRSPSLPRTHLDMADFAILRPIVVGVTAEVMEPCSVCEGNPGFMNRATPARATRNGEMI